MTSDITASQDGIKITAKGNDAYYRGLGSGAILTGSSVKGK